MYHKPYDRADYRNDTKIQCDLFLFTFVFKYIYLIFYLFVRI